MGHTTQVVISNMYRCIGKLTRPINVLRQRNLIHVRVIRGYFN